MSLETTTTDLDEPENRNVRTTLPSEPPADGADPGSLLPAEESPVPAVEARFLDPALLEIGENVRQNFRLEDYPEDTESIQVHGVRQPIKVIRMPDGRLVVRDGQVRTLTALAFEQPLVPVWITDADTAVDEKESEIARIFEQITLNDRRIPLTDGDRAAGIAQALDLGASVTRVSKALQTKRDQVKLARKVGVSSTARELVDDGQFDFEQAAVIADYEAVGDTDAVTRLTKVSRTYFTYEARRIANDRAEHRAYLTAALPYAEAGFGILTDEPYSYGTDLPLRPAGDLVNSATGEPVRDDRIHADPARWLVFLELACDPLYVDRHTGAVVDPQTVDWDTDRNPEAEPRDGLRHAREIDQRDHWRTRFFLPADQLEAAGLRAPEPEQPIDTDTSPADAIETDADDLAARRAAADAAAAQALVERERARLAARRVRELNKQGLAAEETRIEFLTRLLARKTPPQSWAKFVTEALVANSALLGEYNAFDTAQKLLGVTGWRPGLTAAVESAKPARCQVILLGLVLGAYEKRTDKDAWRYSDPGVRRYLQFLREVGHHLVPVELAAIGELDADTIDIDTPSTKVDDTTPLAA
ncbi:ParB/RepB/Spo0J family partition protein [Nocardia blacklockiae]|uniref:ParB/RepB/Spo0J family partition protein n=1 Tax=Nocardia blacklockiae TaxID=480036 RepID=UPI0018942F45|nr:chromosome partitioning protein ParB [Nocardia blacklockiae]MBF6173599.1 chromosome partitioning protein ParB [Nocardia blacklockiae]